MIAHKLKVSLGIVVAIFIVMAFPCFASSDIDVTDYPFYVTLQVASTSGGASAVSQKIEPYRDGNTFYFSSFPYMRNIQFNFYLTNAPQNFTPGISVDSSLNPINTSIPFDVNNAYLIPFHIDSFEINMTYFAERQTSADTWAPVSVDSIVAEYDPSNASNTQSVLAFYDFPRSGSSPVYLDRFPQHNPLVIDFYSLTGGFEASSVALATRLFDYPSYDSPFAVRLRVVIDKFLINGRAIAEEQIITQVNDEIASIYQRLSDYSLNHLTDVSLSDAFNNIDYAADTLENTRFRAIFDSFYGYGIIPTLIVLSLSIAFLGYLLYGKSG